MIRIGISGWRYDPWRKVFYPEGLPQRRELEFCGRHFPTVEINGSFYSLQRPEYYEQWYDQTPQQFLFAVKGSRYITHMLRLKDATEFTEIFLRSIDPLRATHRLGPVLFQLPPYLRCDMKLLADFLAGLPTDIRYSFEFRHASWLVDAVYELLQKHNVALCWAESEKLEVPEVTTADFAYFRLRKAEYPPAERKAISASVTKALADRKDVFVFFKHEDTPDGALYAEELLESSGK